MNLFVVSDIHGMLEQFEKLLLNWDQESILIILGDTIDRGPKSYEVVQKVMALKKQFGEQVVYCKGNHEQMLLDYLEDPENKHERYFRNGGTYTVESFLQQLGQPEMDRVTLAGYLQTQFIEEINFFKQAPHYQVIGQVLFTHAGFNSEEQDYTLTSNLDFIWIREHYKKQNQTPFVNVFGHTPTPTIHESPAIWVSEDKKYINVDGGCYFTGQLNGVLLSEEGNILETYTATGPKSAVVS